VQDLQKLRNVRRLAVVSVIGIALCVMLYNQVKLIVPLNYDNALTFVAGELDLEFYKGESEIGYVDLEKSWSPRVLSKALGSFFARGSIEGREIVPGRFVHLVGLYASLWLGLIFLAYVILLRENALIPILGTYCGVAFGYMPGIADRLFPWDLPALFFFTLFICLLYAGKTRFFLPILPIAVLFKETACVLAIGYLFLESSRRNRILAFGVALALGVATKLIADWATVSGTGLGLDASKLVANFRFIFLGEFPHPEWYIPLQRINHPLLINAGLSLAFILHPSKGRHAKALWAVFLAFTASALIWGLILEYRIWFEMIPVSLYPFYRRNHE
jgi:hypothetical protein